MNNENDLGYTAPDARDPRLGEYENRASSVEYGPSRTAVEQRRQSDKQANRIIATVIALAVVLAAMCGVGGVLLGQGLGGGDGQTVVGDGTGGGGQGLGAPNVENLVIYRAPEDEETSTEPAVKNTAYVAKKSAATVVEVFVKTTSMQSSVSAGIGSGVILTAGGEDTYVITNNHVVDGQEELYVRLSSGEEYAAAVVGTDWMSDVAVLRIQASGLSVAVCDIDNELVLGEDVVVIGNPLGALGGSVSKGVISGLSRTIRVGGVPMTLLQLDAAVNPGNSGGGLFDMDGNLVGIVNAKSVGVDIDGIGFAIPIDTAISVAEQLLRQGYVSGRPDLGLTFSDVTSQGLRISGYENNAELVTRLESGDVLCRLNGVTISSLEDYLGVLATLNVGDKVEATFLRPRSTGWFTQYSEIKVTLTVYEYQPE